MATIRKRNNSYQIAVSCGYDINGKQICRYMTYTPEKGMTKRQIEKELDRQKVLFEEACKNGLAPATGKLKLSEFIEIFFNDYATATLKAKTIVGYHALTPKVDAALGHMRIDRIQPHHLNAFYKNLAEKGARTRITYIPIVDLKEKAKAQKISAAAIEREYGVGASSVLAAFKGKGVYEKTAAAICKALGLSLTKTFKVQGTDMQLSTATIKHYHAFLSSVLGLAVKWQILPSNPCARATLPKTTPKQPAKYLDEEEARKLLELLEKEDMQHKTMIKLLMYTGMRRAELCGLEWSDIDFKKSIITVRRDSVYIPETPYLDTHGIIADTTKNESSTRVIKASTSAMTMLRDYRTWQIERRLQVGDRWEHSNRLFTTAFGKPIHPDTVTGWFSDFVKAHDLPHVAIHSLRHTNATLMINSGVPLPTIAARLGHTDTSTTTKIYVHAIKSADTVAAEQLEDILGDRKENARHSATA